MIIEPVISQHAEDASFLWLQRNAAVNEPHYSLADLTKLDNRVEANIDGLRIAGDAGWAICKQALAWEEAGEFYTAAVLAFESGDKNRIKDVLDSGALQPELARGIISALGWIPLNLAKPHIEELLSSESASLRRIGLSACAIHRIDPGEELIKSLNDSDSLLRARALKAIGELGKVDLFSFTQIDSIEEEKCRFYAARSSLLLGTNYSIADLMAIATSNSNYCEEATMLAVKKMENFAALNWIRELAASIEFRRLSCLAIGAVGDPVLIPTLFEFMSDNKLARIAGEAVSTITGVDIAYEDLEGEWPQGFETGPNDNPKDDNVDMDRDEDVPWPDPELLVKWWEKNKSAFSNGTRYLMGKPISSEWLQHVLRTARQRQRRAAAIELAILNPSQPLFEVRAPGFIQKQKLGLH